MSFPSGFWCEGCGEECHSKYLDTGIGPYDYWGATGIDSQPALVSNCCEAPIHTNPNLNNEYTLRDERDDAKLAMADL